MKNSGIEWIGDVPINWNIRRNKYNFTLNKTLVGNAYSTTQLLSLTKNGVKAISEEDQKGKVPTSFSTYQVVDENDIVMCLFDLDVSAVFSGISHHNGMISPAYKCFKCNADMLPQYVDYYFRAVFVDRKYKRYSKNIRCSIGADEFMALPILVPPIAVQQSIANFLDKKCSEIDALASDIQSQIDTLEQYKKSMITESVTKGLDSNAKMKDSEIFYMAPYNASWRLTKIGYECSKLWRSFKAEDTPLLCTNKGKVAIRPPEMAGKMVSEDNAMQGIRKGDIAIHGMDTWHGAIALSEHDGKITRVVHVCDSTQEKRFIVYYLQQLAFNGVYKLISNGVRGNTSDFRSWDKVKDIYIALPDVEEQTKITDYLDTKCSEIDAVIADKKAQLETLAEYKKSLIYEYVTGKKEVAAND